MIQRWRVVNFLALFCCFDLLQMQPLHIKHSITYICRYQIHFMSVCHLIQSSNTVSQQHTQQGCMRINIFFSGAYTDHLWVTMFYSQPKMRGCSALLFFFPAPSHLFQHPFILGNMNNCVDRLMWSVKCWLCCVVSRLSQSNGLFLMSKHLFLFCMQISFMLECFKN